LKQSKGVFNVSAFFKRLKAVLEEAVAYTQAQGALPPFSWTKKQLV